ncbi:DUF3035 domain-containing protein [Alphaproteobacteria bacterium GH1-50]|uniref:DUF3035 domain-containing protein n=1 Tax=Kangsaoukella pontilimi TaxID=2691042 RepID=A0A7C9N181_9RHOB|nr:DUF3035 domain-containing protein [Kangsaoukella pontilimi]MXQ08578.1 DUF3035 domain-containing protein [Kangsaoukella pontilimi]
MVSRGLPVIIAALALSACGGGGDEPNLLNISQPRSAGPDEFAILPAKPLEMPEDMASLPEPTPGAGNRADLTPERDAIVALGGNPAALTRGAGGDGALLAYTGRYGRDANIRAELAAADLEFRRQNDGRLLERLFNVNIYYQVYEPFELDQYAELERMRRAGIRTSSVPPPPLDDE